MTYERLAMIALRFGLRYLRRRYRRQLLIGAGVAVAAAVAAGYVATREVPEG